MPTAQVSITGLLVEDHREKKGRNMTVRSLMRQEFPRGWWRSLRWWVSGSLGLLCSMLAAVAAVVFIADVLRLLRHRDEPDVVASARVPFEGYLAGALLGCLGLGIALEVLVIRWPLDIFMSVLLGGVIVWCVAHMLVCGTACVVTVRSWLRAPRAWADIDFVSKNLPRHGQPPGTVEEYRALRMFRDNKFGKR
ncbi:MAG: hypothetical protein DI630_33555 [Gordonia sp. (in: high G+C Gram-positive bacteria)]|nr:MAG: hypothetical protein DI630_33555 [Gordonia sp. (in: high G+C Gram-positive bacteria)]